MPGKTKKVFGKKVELYYHQIFFHYVLADGQRVHCAWDRAMKTPLFEYPTYQYQIKDWEFKKKGLLKRLKEEKFIRTSLQTFETDRQTNKKTYLHYFQDLIKPELFEFCQEAQVTCSMTDVWAVRYQKGDHQSIHNHRSWGFTGILYVEYDPKVHTPTCFVAFMARSKV